MAGAPQKADVGLEREHTIDRVYGRDGAQAKDLPRNPCQELAGCLDVETEPGSSSPRLRHGVLEPALQRVRHKRKPESVPERFELRRGTLDRPEPGIPKGDRLLDPLAPQGERRAGRSHQEGHAVALPEDQAPLIDRVLSHLSQAPRRPRCAP